MFIHAQIKIGGMCQVLAAAPCQRSVLPWGLVLTCSHTSCHVELHACTLRVIGSKPPPATVSWADSIRYDVLIYAVTVRGGGGMQYKDAVPHGKKVHFCMEHVPAKFCLGYIRGGLNCDWTVGFYFCPIFSLFTWEYEHSQLIKHLIPGYFRKLKKTTITPP